MTMDDDDITELLDALDAVIKAADPAGREALWRIIKRCAPGDWVSPMFLAHLMTTLEAACRPEAQSKYGRWRHDNGT
jgi:hypothetical protein